MTPVMYPASFFFKEPSTAYIFLIVINLFTGITCIVSSFLLEIFSYDQVDCLSDTDEGVGPIVACLHFSYGLPDRVQDRKTEIEDLAQISSI
jgi:hypothetical protein